MHRLAGPHVPACIVPYAGQRMVTAHPRGEADVHAIWELAEHVLEPHAPELAAHRLLVTPVALEQLRDGGVPVFVEPMDVERWIERLARPLEQVAAGALEDQGAVPLGPFFSKVQELAAIESYLSDLAASSQGRATLMSIGKSIEGRELKVLRITGPGASAIRAVITCSAGGTPASGPVPW